ncbi:MAG: D-Ala-D-Ala carboxypeptidase family metallohydrolase [Leptolyngbyaceae bacterium]|nr:D-Ala-D-Ala carboxypeptidase family metallohydrolase [Leptolyngbyaceae bacterium]
MRHGLARCPPRAPDAQPQVPNITMALTQLQDWRRLAAITLSDIIPRMSNPQLTTLDGTVDDFLRKLVNQPPRPVGRTPYVGLFGNASVSELRQQAASVVQRFLPELSAPDLVPLDEEADRLIRAIQGFSTTRPTGVLPYEGLYGYTILRISQAQIQQFRQQAGARLEQLITGIASTVPTPADNLADALVRALAQPPLPARPSDRPPYEGLFILPSTVPFPELRRRGADTLNLFVRLINDTQLGPKDAVVDAVLRQITNLLDFGGQKVLGDRPANRLPYEGLFPPDPCTGNNPDPNLLSRNFTVEELTRSEAADRLGLSNAPNAEEIANLRRLACKVLQPARDALGPLQITSGFRSAAVNNAVGGVPNSDHRLGYAADVVPINVGTRTFAEWIVRNVPFDQIILEYGTLQNPSWIHVSVNPRNRRQVLRQDSSGIRVITL